MSSSTTPGPRHWWLPRFLDVEKFGASGIVLCRPRCALVARALAAATIDLG